MTEIEKLSAELQVLGVDVTSHLMEHHLQLLREPGTVDAHRLGDLSPGTTVLLLARGSVTRRRPRMSITGTACWDLGELADLRRDHGLDTVAARLAQQLPHPAGSAVRPETMPTGARALGRPPDPGRALLLPAPPRPRHRRTARPPGRRPRPG
ncbi:hypothetical protein AB0E96_10315 [Kitasatospora sp. NPDC036755]|uniref:hypothetical protein n=1 Tax=Kitasatospora sp. NPDC036755 TaxID=3154600 RepID=UPI0033D37555